MGTAPVARIGRLYDFRWRGAGDHKGRPYGPFPKLVSQSYRPRGIRANLP